MKEKHELTIQKDENLKETQLDATNSREKERKQLICMFKNNKPQPSKFEPGANHGLLRKYYKYEMEIDG